MYQWHLRQVPKTTGPPPPIFVLTHRMSQMCRRWIHTEMWEVKHSESGCFPPLPALPVSYKHNPQNQHSCLLPSVGSLAYKGIVEISSAIKCNCSFNPCNMRVNEDVNVTSSCRFFFFLKRFQYYILIVSLLLTKTKIQHLNFQHLSIDLITLQSL